VGTGVLNLVNILSTYLFQAVLCWRCVENQEYWVAVPERERDTVVFLTRLTLWCNVVINVYIICSVAIVLAANRRTDARPTTVDTVLQAVFLITAVAFFVLLFHQLKQRFTKHAYSAVRTNRV
jgi:glucan phosphoethanolaminetransferase (alkaline phosphatase superfamily)